VVAIGNALGQYSNTVTSGIVSGVGRPVTAQSGNGQTESLTDLIQTDASINPGNSGGPLLNMAGQVIGINTAVAADANGIGFSIPINSTKGILAGVLSNGKVSRAYIGVNYLSVTPDVAKEYKLSVDDGAYVYAANGSAVASGSPAEKAGLRNGDIITKVNNDTIGKQGSLASIIGQYQPGNTVTLTYIRDGKQQTTEVTFSTYNS
jgi:serine protease Do